MIKRCLLSIFLYFAFFSAPFSQVYLDEVYFTPLTLINTIKGKIAPKSIVHNNKGKFFAQNMMYRHTVTVYDRTFNLITTIKDEVKLKEYGYEQYEDNYKGAPVECAFSDDGKYAWVSNYEMSGGNKKEFNKPGCDGCIGTKYDNSFIYKINTETYTIENVVEVGSVPKFLAVTPNNKMVLVSNWTSSDLSIVSTELNKEIKRIKLGALPRGIAINSRSTYAYVAIMGSDKIAKVNLINYDVSWIDNVGSGPRHICISPDDRYLYVTINNESRVAKISLDTYKIKKVKTGSAPRSMAISGDGLFLYVVNYSSNTISKLDASTLTILDEQKTNNHPIGITFDEKEHNVWVACYSGRVLVFHDGFYDKVDVTKPLVVNKENKASYDFLSSFYKEDKEQITTQLLTPREIADIMNETEEDISIVSYADFQKKVKEKKEEEKKELSKQQKLQERLAKEEEIRRKIEERQRIRKTTEKNVKADNSKENNKEKKEETKKSSASNSSNKGYLAVVGSYEEERHAKRKMDRFIADGYASTTYFLCKDKGLYLTYVGVFESREEAVGFGKEKGVKIWVYHNK